ncbi:MAG: hypothetical protein H6Q21_20 [Bacteroidetes bacterium]|jgi:hypothetical protein|nr:hypothetical protein [Bacteroidota bacterium]MBS1233814.1 hypothetical protein [Bacteroidota bacterium]
MTGFIRIILLLVLFYYLTRIITRYLVPFLFGSYVNRKMNDFQGRSGRQQKTHNRKKEGEVTVDYTPQEGNKNKDRGEYVEYEEIKD